ncbi:MAG: RloB domain-containing protein, partial [Deltaproteobacteria bacterium]|nr:RloB domain-containing protein [Deltaproteobacteria bacterium]
MLSVEGRKTEQEYFNLFKEKGSLVTVLCLRSSSRSSPTDVLQRMKKHLKKEPLEGSDEAWLVVDYDQWPPEHFYKLHAWTQQKDKCFLAVSNPKFEYWLLLHFEDGRGVATPKECDTRLKKHLPNYS